MISDRAGSRFVYAALLAFVIGFAVFPPRVFLIVDEERYVSQAVAFARGGLTIPGAEILYPPPRSTLISDFPPGTSLLQTPLVWLAGWRAAAILSVIGLIVATALTMRWLRADGFNAAFALLVPAFVGALFFGRVAMSDVPSAALVALAAYLLTRAGDAGRVKPFFAGLVMGATLLFREPLIVLVAPLFIAAFFHPAAHRVGLIAGAAAGVAVRLVISAALFGSAWYVRDSGYGFSLGSLAHTFPVYAIILLVMFPGAALLPFFYRGPWRKAMIAAVAMYLLLFLLYEYDSVRENGPAKGVILASRYIVPALPLLAYMAADVWPRWLARLGTKWQALVSRLALAGSAAVVLLALLVHPLARTQEVVPLAITNAIYSHTSSDVPLITNTNATLKYLSPSYGARKLVLRQAIAVDSVRAFARRGPLGIALLDRVDSELFRAESRDNALFLEGVEARCRLRRVYEGAIGSWAYLRVAEVQGCE